MNLLRLSAGRRAKWVVLAGWTAIVLLLGSSALDFNDAQKNRDADYLPQSAQSLKAIELETKGFGDELLTGMLVYQRAGKLTARDRGTVAAAAKELTARPLRGQYGKPLPMFMRDGRTAAVYTQLRTHGDKQLLLENAARLRAIGARAPAGLNVKLTGQTGFFNDQVEILDGIDESLLSGTVLLISVLLLLIYRSPLLWLLPLTAVGFAEVTSRGLGTWLAEQGTTTITSQAAALMTVLVFGVGTDYALLLIARYRDELRRHDDPHEAMSEALARSAPTILASAATVICALLCLTLADVNATAGAGPIGAMGIAIAMLAMLTLLPALLLTFGRPAFWPFIPRVGATTRAEPHFWVGLSAVIQRHPLRVVLGVSLLMLIMALGLTARPGGLDLAGSFHKPVDSVTGMQMLERALPHGATGPMTVLAEDGKRVPAVIAALKRSPDVAAVGLIQQARGVTRIEATLQHTPYSSQAIDAVKRVRTTVTKASGGTALIAGATAVEADSREFAAHDNRLIMPLVLIVVFLVLLILLRSIVAPIVLMITVVASFVAVMGASYWAFEHIFGYSGVDEYVPIFVFIFLVALGVDYNIFLMARVREEVARFGAREGMRRGLVVTGGVITSAGIVLAGTFFVMASMPITMLTEIGFAIAVGVLFDALVVRTALVPALGFLLGEKLWWPARLDPTDQPRSGTSTTEFAVRVHAVPRLGTEAAPARAVRQAPEA